MNYLRPKLTKEEKTAKDLAANAVKKEMFRLASKIISWRTKSVDSPSIQNQEKITKLEWQQYEQHLLDISKTQSVKEVKEKLITIFAAIQNNQGFK